MEEHIYTNEENGILYVTMNRPDRLNAFSEDMLSGVVQALAHAGESEAIKAVVLIGAGRSFSAGGDVKTMGDVTPEQIYDHIGKLNETILAIKSLEKPVIAAVHGFAAGAGFNLVMACDLVIAEMKSKFTLSFAQVGLMSDGGGSYFLPKLIGIHRAKELMFSGEPINASTAKEWGLVNTLVQEDEMEYNVKAYAEKIASGPVKAFGMMKKVMDHSLNADLDEILEQERITQTLLTASDDHKEGVQAFQEKRKPAFHGA
ncbi:enoyl-CoA hydratase/isomerase family protein [Thalassobacillus sp. CUG 92003]|uniref:enoyl-CoA hydratase/isomerase family protein n=1 Tax=Thalassobacillus sp. CUG 92003 TaxID=2736641 RepID=UPI0015E6931D|nr:enoyl-CoA hydratase [Thalassobacillus sp. CUG 92003]